MCGIAGYVACAASGSLPTEQELLDVRDAMVSRGPDGSGLWIEPGRQAALAHRRLSILDLSDHGAQPMFSHDGRLAIAFNGEIYNFQELRDGLLAKGHSFRSTGDTEVLLALYAEYGEEMVHRLGGMFAFAIWDAAKQTMFLARDPLGIKPLYYGEVGGAVCFASQAKALLHLPQLDRSPNPAGLAGFCLWGSVPDPHTMYRGIRSLPAGTTMLVRAGSKPILRKYADAAQELSAGAEHPSTASLSQTQEMLHAALRSTMQRHLVSDVPVALFLSAGLDSTTMLALMKELPGANINSITLGFDQTRGTENDETVIAQSLAAQYGAKHQFQYVTQQDFHSERDALLAAMDQPTIDGVNTYFVSRLCKMSGYKVALSGVGGDELFAGYPSFSNIPSMVSIAGPLSHIPGIGKAWHIASSAFLKRSGSPKYAGLLTYGGTFPGAYLLRRGLYMPWELPRLLGPEVAAEGLRELHPILSMQEMLRPLDQVRSPQSARLKVSALELSMYMRNQLLRDSDWAGMAHSIEIRTPLADFTLLRELAPLLAGSHPPGKQQMASSPALPLPPAILSRAKTGFSVPVREWLMGDDPSIAERGLRGWSRLILAPYLQQL
ncbi:MAG: asparagine synthase (glutamine-hydrolyzing) [Acidobacteriaceae bacterium]